MGTAVSTESLPSVVAQPGVFSVPLDVGASAASTDNRLESLGESCPTTATDDSYLVRMRCRGELRRCRCDSWFCPWCGPIKGQELRRLLVDALLKWSDTPLFVTLTVDRSLFEGPTEAYTWVREHHAIGRLVGRLKRAGFLRSGRFFCILEFQRDGGWPHWHLLVDAAFIPENAISAEWAKFRPDRDGRWGERTGLGWVAVRGCQFDGRIHAANYMTKYVLKGPEFGWPDWVVAFEGRRARYSCSRGLLDWGPARRGRGARSRGSVAMAVAHGRPAGRVAAAPVRRRKTVGERLASCGKASGVFVVRELMTLRDEEAGERGGEVVERKRVLVATIAGTIDELRSRFELRGFGATGVKWLSQWETLQLCNAGRVVKGGLVERWLSGFLTNGLVPWS